MLFKLILSQVICEPRYSLIANRTIHPSSRSLKTCVRSNVNMASPVCCCSLKIKDTCLIARCYMTNGYHDGKRTRDSGGTLRGLRSNESLSEREALRQRIDAFSRQARKSSIQRCEPCYQQIYPSKKRKATFTIPKKPPYIPAVNQRKTTSYRDKYIKMEVESAKGKRLQWPPLYATKRKENSQPKQSQNSHNLPPWLLPIYSCKSVNKSAPTSIEAKFSGGAFRKKMELIETLRHMQNQNIQSGLRITAAKKEEKPRETTKLPNAVESLKERIYNMKGYLTALKNMEALKNKQYSQKLSEETEPAEPPIPFERAYATLYPTKLPTLEREVKVRNSLGIIRPKSFDNPKNVSEHEAVNEGEIKTHEGVEMNGSSLAKYTTDSLLGQIHKESVVMVKQPAWKQQHPVNMFSDESTQTQNKQTSNVKTNVEGKSIRRQQEPVSDLMNPQSKTKETKTAEEYVKQKDGWSVDSLKSRINFMKVRNTMEESSMKKAEDMSVTKNGGEAKPKISQVALRSFHKEAGAKRPNRVQNVNVKKQIGYQKTTTRRNYSAFQPLRTDVARTFGNQRRNLSSKPQSKRRNWVSCLKRCFVLKKIKKPKWENWKDTPREITYESEQVKCNSPAPILWKPSNGDSHPKQSKPIEVEEKVNPAVLNAEHRVLASISRLVTNPPVPENRITEVEKRIGRARMKVNLMPWFKKPNSVVTHKLPTLKGLAKKPEKEEEQENGYTWILKNRDTVEELKRQSRRAAGKPLVPTEVKNSINGYKLPLKAEISQYRKRMEQKSGNVYFYSTSRRWYSCRACQQRKFLSSSDFMLINTRGFKTVNSQKVNSFPSKFLDKRARINIQLRQNIRRLRIFNDTGKSDQENTEDIKPKKWGWKIPHKTRSFTPVAPLTAPSRFSGTRMSEISPGTLKKQVEELKKLIKKAREDVLEETEQSKIDPIVGDKYEARLKRLVKAAHNNALRMQIVKPKYTSENNMLTSKQEYQKKNRLNQSIPSDQNPKTEETNAVADEFVFRNNHKFQSNEKSEQPTSRVYLKLKSLVDAVRKKSSALGPINTVKHPTKSLRGSISASAILHSNEEAVKPSCNIQPKNAPEESSPVVELHAQQTPAPSNTIKLWKGQSKPKEFNFKQDSVNEPTYGDLLTLFTRAKSLFYYQPPEDEKHSEKPTELSNESDNTSPNQIELTKSWLSIREDVSSAARAVSEQKNDHPKVLDNVHNTPGIDSVKYMMTKSNMIPFELLKSKPTNDNMWATAPVKVQEDGDISRGSQQSGNTDDNQKANQQMCPENKEMRSNAESDKEETDTKTRVIQKPMGAWECITKNISDGLFGTEIQNVDEKVNNLSTSSKQEPNTEVRGAHSRVPSGQQIIPPHTIAASIAPLVSGYPENLNRREILINSKTETKPSPETYVPDTKPMEESFRKYEDYYRNYFTEDVVRGYDHLQQIYESLNKLNNEIQNCIVEPLKKSGNAPSTGMTQEATSESGGCENYTGGFTMIDPKQDEEKLVTSEDHMSSSMPEATSASWSEHNAQATSGGSEPEYHQPFNTAQSVDPSGQKETHPQPTRTEKTPPAHQCASEPSTTPEFAKQDPNIEGILTQDPTLNPKVVKNLKLPVILSEDCQTEKNWYTKLYTGPQHNH